MLASSGRSRPTSSWAMLASILLGLAPACVSATPNHRVAANDTETSVVSPAYIGVNADPDATGRVPVPGFDLTTPFPGKASAGWSLELNVTRYATAPPGPITIVGYDGNTTLITTRLVPPPPGSPGALYNTDGSWALSDGDASNSSSSSSSSTWSVTMVSWTERAMRVVPDGNDLEDGSCPESAFSQECADKIRRAVMEDPSLADKDDFSTTPIPQCGGYTTAFSTTIPMNSTFMNSSSFSLGIANSVDAYNVIGARTFPILLVWGRSSDTRTPLPEDHVQLACVKVDTVVRDGAVLPTSSAGPGGGGGVRTPGEARRLAWYVAGLAGVVGLVLVG
ncbi:uncharacterized protein B0I36DRAFT_319217 [Microdochium trichocladiopsis]|uniref:Uncharacterized protein n=1 Tax=Microdochium trichocladiopsis TaxID=1682393 RepID=A0A9P8YCP6_9PEZI|nr:uncharacterized protein B0I36DRAFT_319217 [Microdochium trichocladiopsis]KAH7035857.1 hypothetical protein B0I36DRAFT_319217 [Microdochium trichocladiopsis]